MERKLSSKLLTPTPAPIAGGQGLINNPFTILRIMKKEYVKPDMVIEQFMVELAFLVGSDTEVGGGGDGEGIPKDANDHRGSWGNLWD